MEIHNEARGARRLTWEVEAEGAGEAVSGALRRSARRSGPTGDAARLFGAASPGGCLAVIVRGADEHGFGGVEVREDDDCNGGDEKGEEHGGVSGEQLAVSSER